MVKRRLCQTREVNRVAGILRHTSLCKSARTVTISSLPAHIALSNNSLLAVEKVGVTAHRASRTECRTDITQTGKSRRVSGHQVSTENDQ